jgi:protein arginine N-methyltransferase 1
MFDSVIYARNKWLSEGGMLFPNKAQMFIAAIDDDVYYKKKLVFFILFRIFGTMFMELV